MKYYKYKEHSYTFTMDNRVLITGPSRKWLEKPEPIYYDYLQELTDKEIDELGLRINEIDLILFGFNV